MTIARSFEQLDASLLRLLETLQALETTVEHDRPQCGDVALASTLGDALVQALGTLQECRSELLAREAMAGAWPGSEADRRALARCQERFHGFNEQFELQVASLTTAEHVANVARERGGEWVGWACVLRDSLELSQLQVREAREAMFQCWLELTERGATTAISVRAAGVVHPSATA